MTLKASFNLMADYNQWMNNNVYSSAARMSAADLSEDRGAFFGSVLGSLNHILVADVIWLKRFSDHPHKFTSLDYVLTFEDPQSLDEILFAEFSELRKKRSEMDEVIKNFADELTDEILGSTFRYKGMRGKPYNKKFGLVIQHFFNHQTHHRGQISTLLNQADIDIGTTDLLVRIPD